LIGHGLSPPEFGVHVGIRDWLQTVASAYKALATAASHRNRAAYATAQGALGSATQNLSARLDQLAHGGYTLS
jgi:hypothetical protein